MADNNNDDDLCHCIEAQEQTSRAHQEALDDIQCMLTQLLTDRNNKKNSDNNEREEENKTPEKKNA